MLHAHLNSTKPISFSDDKECAQAFLESGGVACNSRGFIPSRTSGVASNAPPAPLSFHHQFLEQTGLLDKLEFNVLRYKTVPDGTRQKLSDCVSAHRSVVEGEVVHVHSDKAISLVAIQTPSQRH